jgi:hypothetical protein
MSAPVRGDRALRFNSRMARRLWLSLLLWLVLLPLFSWFLLLGTGVGDVIDIAIAAGVVAVLVFVPQLYVYLRIRGLRLVGERLVRGRKSCELSTSWDINLEVAERQAGLRRVGQRLFLHAEDLRVVLGSMTLPSFFEPEDLRRLADVLARSTHPGPQEAAEHLNRLADEESRESWPPPRPS